MTSWAIKVDHLSKSFNTKLKRNNSIFDRLTSKHQDNYEINPVLNDISFEIKKGELVGVIGKNGIGKTTLMRMISHVYKPDSGKIITDGKVALFLELGTGFQLDLSARENIILYGMMIGFTKNEIIKRIPKILQFAELEKYENSELKHFSSGMFARLAFSTAIEMDYDIFLIDELLAVGDQEFQKTSFDTFMNLKKQGKTFLVVSHNHNMLKQICDRLILLHDGKILSIGDPQKVIDEYNRSVKVWKD